MKKEKEKELRAEKKIPGPILDFPRSYQDKVGLSQILLLSSLLTYYALKV